VSQNDTQRLSYAANYYHRLDYIVIHDTLVA